MSLDGRSALANGVSQWITGADARLDVQHWRARSCAVLTGINTILSDDAQLNVRELMGSPPLTAEGSLQGSGAHTGVPLAGERGGREGLRQPLRVVLDSTLRMPLDAKILHGGVLIYSALDDRQQISRLQDAGAQVVVLPDSNGRVDLPAMLRDLARRGCNEVLVEAGAVLNGALLSAGLVDELLLYIAPQLLGDAARGIANLGELTNLEQSVKLHWKDVRQVGDDLRITAKVQNKVVIDKTTSHSTKPASWQVAGYPAQAGI